MNIGDLVDIRLNIWRNGEVHEEWRCGFIEDIGQDKFLVRYRLNDWGPGDVGFHFVQMPMDGNGTLWKNLRPKGTPWRPE